MPSSIAVATRDTIRPTLTSASAQLRHGARRAGYRTAGRRAITDFYDRVRERYPYPPTYRRRPDATTKSFAAPLRERDFAADAFGVDPCRARARRGGRPPRRGALRRDRARSARAAMVGASSCHASGSGRSDRATTSSSCRRSRRSSTRQAAELLGVEPGQVTLQYHGGGGVAPGRARHAVRAAQALPAAGAHPDGGAKAALPPRASTVGRRASTAKGAVLLATTARRSSGTAPRASG